DDFLKRPEDTTSRDRLLKLWKPPEPSSVPKKEIEKSELPPFVSDEKFETVGGQPSPGGLPMLIRHKDSGIIFVLITPEGREIFYIAQTPVTIAQWKKAGGKAGDKRKPYVTDVSTADVKHWCKSNGLSLPSEEQWSYARNNAKYGLKFYNLYELLDKQYDGYNSIKKDDNKPEWRNNSGIIFSKNSGHIKVTFRPIVRRKAQ
ncbi:MAG: hypothetical protein COB96_06400, partial [Planctomycetota bacterium]